MAIKECVICGLQFDARTFGKYCTDTCKKHGKRVNDSHAKTSRKTKTITRNCIICDKSFKPHGPQKVCSITCRKEKDREYKRNNKPSSDQLIAYRKQYYAKNAEKLREKSRAWRDNNHERKKEADRNRARLNPEKNRERVRIWRQENIEYVRERNRLRYNSQTAAASMLEACAAMMRINERGNNHETE